MAVRCIKPEDGVVLILTVTAGVFVDPCALCSIHQQPYVSPESTPVQRLACSTWDQVMLLGVLRILDVLHMHSGRQEGRCSKTELNLMVRRRGAGQSAMGSVGVF
jgi:hypothetical protein